MKTWEIQSIFTIVQIMARTGGECYIWGSYLALLDLNIIKIETKMYHFTVPSVGEYFLYTKLFLLFCLWNFIIPDLSTNTCYSKCRLTIEIHPLVNSFLTHPHISRQVIIILAPSLRGDVLGAMLTNNMSWPNNIFICLNGFLL